MTSASEISITATFRRPVPVALAVRRKLGPAKSEKEQSNRRFLNPDGREPKEQSDKKTQPDQVAIVGSHVTCTTLALDLKDEQRTLVRCAMETVPVQLAATRHSHAVGIAAAMSLAITQSRLPSSLLHWKPFRSQSPGSSYPS